MAKFACLILLALLAFSMVADIVMAEGHIDRVLTRKGKRKGKLTKGQCAPECKRRCGKTQYKKPCLFFCNKCCATCLCVPPGFYGNKQVCPCYNNWKTKEGRPKCP